MTDEPRDYAAERLAARAETCRTNVARLRALIGAGGSDTDHAPEENS